MFTQQISMDCSEGQYKELFPLLRAMGYVEGKGEASEKKIIVNNWDECHGEVGLTFSGREYENGREYLGEFNEPLFLARAAMTDSEFGGVGEWWRYEGENNCWFTYNKLYKAQGSLDNEGAFITDVGNSAGSHPSNLNYFRKATVEEITNHFTNKVMEEKTFTTTREGMKSIHNVACSTWKPKIEGMIKDYQENPFSNNVTLPERVVKLMFEAATTDQLPVLQSVFPTFQSKPEDKNAFIREFETYDDMLDINRKLFGNDTTIRIGNGLVPDELSYLKGKCFLIDNGAHDLILHKGDSNTTIIEIRKK